MKIILLRHEERNILNPSYFTPLTENGIKNSVFLVDKLKKYKIHKIYCSPFLRTIQTIYPYAIHINKKIRLDYGLYEYIHNPFFLFDFQWFHNISEIDDQELKNICHSKYQSIIQKDDFQYLENENSLTQRITKFIESLKIKHKKPQPSVIG